MTQKLFPLVPITKRKTQIIHSYLQSEMAESFKGGMRLSKAPSSS